MKDLEGDKLHVLVLFFLYILQVKPNNKQENSPFVFYYCRASLLAWSTLCHLCLGRRRWKKAPAPKLWPYHKYHQYNDISKVTIIPILTPVSSVQRSSKVSYEEQAKFSISSYPFSMKLLWAPLVDSIYVARSYNLATFKIEMCQLLCFNFAQLSLSGLAGESLGWFQFST